MCCVPVGVAGSVVEGRAAGERGSEREGGEGEERGGGEAAEREGEKGEGGRAR